MFGKKDKKHIEEIAIVFDIGSASVGGALVSLKYPGKPSILYTTRKDIRFTGQTTSERLLSSMESTLKEVATNIQKNGIKRLTFTKLGKKSIKDIYCVFSSPWYVSQTKILHSEYNKPETITKSLIRKYIEKEEESFLESSAGKYSEKNADELHILEHNVIQLRLNGYETTKPYGKTTKSIDLSLFLSMIPEVVAKGAIQIISDVFNTESLHMHSFALVSYSVIRSVFENNDNFLLLDIGGEVTDVSLIIEDVLVESASFPFGKNKLAKILSEYFNTTPEEALSRIVIHGNDADDLIALGKVKDIILKVKEDWNKELKNIIDDFSDTYPVPQTMYFLSDNNIAPVMKDFIDTGSVSKSISPDGNFSSNDINNMVLEKYIEYKNNAKKDYFLGIEALFFNTFHNDNK